MVPKTSKIRCRRGFSLVSIMTAIVIILVALIGTSNFRYYDAILDAQKAAVKITASRIGLMLCENCRGLGGAETYDPATYFGSDLIITQSADAAEADNKSTHPQASLEAATQQKQPPLTISEFASKIRSVVLQQKQEQVEESFSQAEEIQAAEDHKN